jgi:signal peptidase I
VASDEIDGSEEPPAGAVKPADTAQSEPERGRRRPRKPSSRRRTLVETAIGLAIAVVIALLVRTFVFQAYFVPSGSMEPTLQQGDRILVDKFDFNFHSIHPNDIVVFHTPPAARRDCATEDGDLVKRVVAVGGQSIRSTGNLVFIRNAGSKKWHRLPESYFPDDGTHTDLGQPIIRYTVPMNDFYVLGDNRTVSCDSRIWGPFPGTDIVGRVVAVVWRSWHPDLIIF